MTRFGRRHFAIVILAAASQVAVFGGSFSGWLTVQQEQGESTDERVPAPPGRVVANPPVPLSDVEFVIIDEFGDELRTVRCYRVSENQDAPNRYLVWPVATWLLNRQPIEGMPSVVHAVTEPDGFGIRRVELKASLGSTQLLELSKLKIASLDSRWLEQKQVDLNNVVVSSFPIPHGIVSLSIAGEPFYTADVGQMSATTMRASWFIGLTPSQLQQFIDAATAGTLEMQWWFQYRGASGVVRGRIEQQMNEERVRDSLKWLDNDMRQGRTAILRQEDRERVASSVRQTIRQTVVADVGAIPLLNLDQMLPRLLDAWRLEGQSLAEYLDSRESAEDLANYLQPQLQQYVRQVARIDAGVEVEQDSSQSGAGGGSGFRLGIGPIGFSMGGTKQEVEAALDSVSRSTGVTFSDVVQGTEIKPTQIDTFRLKELNGIVQSLVRQEVFISAGEENGYVTDSRVSVSQTADQFKADVNRMLEGARFISNRSELEEKILRQLDATARQQCESLVRQRNDAWRQTQHLSFGSPRGRWSPFSHYPLNDARTIVRLTEVHQFEFDYSYLGTASLTRAGQEQLKAKLKAEEEFVKRNRGSTVVIPRDLHGEWRDLGHPGVGDRGEHIFRVLPASGAVAIDEVTFVWSNAEATIEKPAQREDRLGMPSYFFRYMDALNVYQPQHVPGKSLGPRIPFREIVVKFSDQRVVKLKLEKMPSTKDVAEETHRWQDIDRPGSFIVTPVGDPYSFETEFPRFAADIPSGEEIRGWSAETLKQQADSLGIVINNP